MKAVVERCAGIDVGKSRLNVCVLTGAADQEPEGELRKFATFNPDLERLREWLLPIDNTQVTDSDKSQNRQ